MLFRSRTPPTPSFCLCLQPQASFFVRMQVLQYVQQYAGALDALTSSLAVERTFTFASVQRDAVLAFLRDMTATCVRLQRISRLFRTTAMGFFSSLIFPP